MLLLRDGPKSTPCGLWRMPCSLPWRGTNDEVDTTRPAQAGHRDRRGDAASRPPAAVACRQRPRTEPAHHALPRRAPPGARDPPTRQAGEPLPHPAGPGELRESGWDDGDPRPRATGGPGEHQVLPDPRAAGRALVPPP